MSGRTWACLLRCHPAARASPLPSPAHTWVPARPPGSCPDVSLAVPFKAPPASTSECWSGCRRVRILICCVCPTPAHRAFPVWSGSACTVAEGEGEQTACGSAGRALPAKGSLLPGVVGAVSQMQSLQTWAVAHHAWDRSPLRSALALSGVRGLWPC
jgi:hypothetical protein